MTTIRAALLLAAAVACAGCLELTQEIWVNGDGSGRTAFDIIVPQGIVEMVEEADEGGAMEEKLAEYERLKADPSQIPNLKGLDFREYVEGEFHHYVIEIEVQDVSRLPETIAALEDHTDSDVDTEGREQTEALASPSSMTLERLGNGKMLFVQTLVSDSMVAAKAEGSEGETAAGKAMMASMFAGKFYTVRLHALKVVSTNGTLDETARSVEWVVPMAEIVSQEAPRELRAEVQIGS